jgi:hypothetical protein
LGGGEVIGDFFSQEVEALTLEVGGLTPLLARSLVVAAIVAVAFLRT